MNQGYLLENYYNNSGSSGMVSYRQILCNFWQQGQEYLQTYNMWDKGKRKVRMKGIKALFFFCCCCFLILFHFGVILFWTKNMTYSDREDCGNNECNQIRSLVLNMLSLRYVLIIMLSLSRYFNIQIWCFYNSQTLK